MRQRAPACSRRAAGDAQSLDRTASTMELADRLEELGAEIELFVCRPPTLLGDLVLFGLATDVLETAEAVLNTAVSGLPHKAYANARLAFEGAQNLLALSTHEDYPAAGARAWVYFESKSAKWRASRRAQHHQADTGSAEKWLDQRVGQMAGIWDSVCPGKSALLFDAVKLVRKTGKKPPDNWLHENMADREDRAYAMFAARGSREMSGHTAELSKMMYAVLCHETHSHPRLDSFGLVSGHREGVLRVDRLPRDLSQARHAVTSGTELAVWDAALALRWQRSGAV